MNTNENKPAIEYMMENIDTTTASTENQLDQLGNGTIKGTRNIGSSGVYIRKNEAGAAAIGKGTRVSVQAGTDSNGKGYILIRQEGDSCVLCGEQLVSETTDPFAYVKSENGEVCICGSCIDALAYHRAALRYLEKENPSAVPSKPLTLKNFTRMKVDSRLSEEAQKKLALAKEGFLLVSEEEAAATTEETPEVKPVVDMPEPVVEEKPETVEAPETPVVVEESKPVKPAPAKKPRRSRKATASTGTKAKAPAKKRAKKTATKAAPKTTAKTTRRKTKATSDKTATVENK